MPQWKVIKEGHVIGGSTQVELTFPFLKEGGLYRFSGYISAKGPAQSGTYWQLAFGWADRSGRGGQLSVQASLDPDYLPFGEIGPYIFSPVQTPLEKPHADVGPSNPAPQNSTYDVAYTIEKLTR